MITEKKTRLSRGATAVAGVTLMLLFFSDPSGTARAARRGAELCLTTLIPSVFPFMAASGIVIGSGAGSALGKLFSPAMKIFDLPGECAAPLVMGILCGSPVGAVTLADLYRRGAISSGDGARLLSFCCYPSLPFLISAVGVGLFGSRRAGILLAFSVLTAGLVCGAVAGVFSRFGKRRSEAKASAGVSIPDLRPVGKIVSDALTGAAGSMISVCACVVFFSALTDAVCRLGRSAGLFGISLASLTAFFELTSGSASAADLGMPDGLVLCAAAAGWSGLSVHFQIMNAVPPGISLRPYFVSKAAQALLSPLICAFLSRRYMSESVFMPGAELSGVFGSSGLAFAFPVHALWIASGIFALSVSVIILLCKNLDRRRRI